MSLTGLVYFTASDSGNISMSPIEFVSVCHINTHLVKIGVGYRTLAISVMTGIQ